MPGVAAGALLTGLVQEAMIALVGLGYTIVDEMLELVHPAGLPGKMGTEKV